MRSWIAAGTLALVLAVGLALPAEAAHRHSRTCGHRYSYSNGYSDRYAYGYSNRYAYGYSDRYRYPTYDYGYRDRYNYVRYGYYSPYRYGAPYVLYAPPPPAYGYYYAPYRRHVRPHVSVTLGLW
jgi:hypothetical protein